jgi:ParB/RepB/Spo0J family partition protein
MSTMQTQTPEIDTDKVDVPKDFNSRSHFDKAELEALAASIERVGVINPIKVRPGKSGHVELVAGERRLRAAKLAGLKTIPFTFGNGNGRDEAFFENHSRADLNPIETARDIEALAEEHNFTSNADIAAFINPSKPKLRLKWVGEHRRLLALPKEVQRYIAARDVPISAEPKLREIAKVSPKIAALICEVAKKNKVSGQAFVQRFGDQLRTVGGNADELGVTMIEAAGFRLSEVVEDKEKRKSLADRINPMLMEYQRSEDPRFQFTESDVDAARAAGCLVEYHSNGNGYNAFNTYVIDRSYAEDLIERAVETAEQEVATAAERAKEEKEKAKDEREKAREQQKELGEETHQAKVKKRKAIARRFNDALKRTLLKKRTPARRKKYGLARSKAIAVQLISDNPELAAAGLRLVSDQLQDVEVKALKKGGNREKVTYATKQECNAELLRRVLAAKDSDEVEEIVAEALIAGLLADREEFPSKDHVGWHTPVASDLERLMATEIKEVRPRRIPKPKL